MRLNGWWRIAAVIMVLIMAISIMRAATETSLVDTAFIQDDPPSESFPKNSLNQYYFAKGYCPQCEIYEKNRTRSMLELARISAVKNKCFKRTIEYREIAENQNYDQQASHIELWCQTSGNALSIVTSALAFCAFITAFGLVVGWIAAGFRNDRARTRP